jgi:hypothetical protein
VANLSKIGIVITGDNSSAQSSIQGTLSSIKMFTGITAGLSVATAALAGVSAAINLAADSLRSFQAVAQRVGQVDDFAKKLSIAPEILTALGRGAEHEGSSFETLSNGIDRMNSVLGDAINGSETAKKAFTDLGLSVESLAGMSADQAMGAIADSLSQFGGAQRQSFGEAIFGKTFRELDLFMSGGSKAFDEYIAKAKELGIGFSTLQAEGIAAADDALSDIWKQFEGISTRLAADLAPSVAVLAESFSAFLSLVSDAGMLDMMIPIAEEIAGAIFTFGEWAKYLVQSLTWLINQLPGVDAEFTFKSPEFTKLLNEFKTRIAREADARDKKFNVGPGQILPKWGTGSVPGVENPNNQGGPFSRGTAGALDIGTAAAYAAAFGKMEPKEVEQKKTNKLITEGNKELAKMSRALEGLAVVPV